MTSHPKTWVRDFHGDGKSPSKLRYTLLGGKTDMTVSNFGIGGAAFCT